MTCRAVAVILGASEFPLFPSFAPCPPFAKAAQGMRQYFLETSGLALAKEDVLDLFDSPERWVDQDEAIRHFFADRPSASDCYVYYVGHGYFGKGEDYLLACRRAEVGRRELTAIGVRSLADTLNEHFRRKRMYVVLDCCFAGAAIPAFQSDPAEVAQRLSARSLPAAGTALLLASSKDSPAHLGTELPLFTDALLDVLTFGVPNLGPRLSFADLREEVYQRITRHAGKDGSTPQVATPAQPFGDLSHEKVFPNRAHDSAPIVIDVAFRVSRDEENVEVVVGFRGRDVLLKGRTHHYLLLTLARARANDASFVSSERGWIYADQLARQLAVSIESVNVQIHRLRTAFSAVDPRFGPLLFERRSTTKQVRLGDSVRVVSFGAADVMDS